jgi:hypothetical protein
LIIACTLQGQSWPKPSKAQATAQANAQEVRSGDDKEGDESMTGGEMAHQSNTFFGAGARG